MLPVASFVLGASHAAAPGEWGSACVAIRTPTEVIVGTDSKRVFSDKTKAPDSVCKIHRFGSVWFTQTGLYRSGNNLDVVAIAQEACQGDGTLSNKVARFESLMRIKLAQSMAVIQREQPTEYKTTFANRRVIDAAFWSLDEDVPVLHTLFFNVGSSESGTPVVKVERQVCPGDCPGGEGVIYLGHSDAMRAYVAQHPKIFDGDLGTAIEKLINVQGRATPETVGGEVDVIRLTKEGAQWVKRKQECADTSNRP